LARELCPDAVLVDLGLPDRDGVDLVRALRRASPTTPLLVLTSATHPSRIIEALRAGARSYLFKDDIAGKLDAAVRELLAGGAPRIHRRCRGARRHSHTRRRSPMFWTRKQRLRARPLARAALLAVAAAATLAAAAPASAQDFGYGSFHTGDAPGAGETRPTLL